MIPLGNFGVIFVVVNDGRKMMENGEKWGFGVI
jgi:hypothetical protein